MNSSLSIVLIRLLFFKDVQKYDDNVDKQPTKTSHIPEERINIPTRQSVGCPHCALIDLGTADVL